MRDNGPRGAGHAPRTGKKVARRWLYEKKYVDLDQYIADYKARRIASYSKLPREQRVELFGSSIVPIHVPLARWETAEDYEERFVEWLTRKGLTMRELVSSENDFFERGYRIEFANLNATGVEAFKPSSSSKRARAKSCDSPKKRRATEQNERTEDEGCSNEEPHVCCVQRPESGASTVEVADAFTACGCVQCLVETVRFLARKITQLDEAVS